MTTWELGLQTIGVVWEVVGLMTAVVGVGHAWARNAEAGDSMPARIFGPPIRILWAKVSRRKIRPNLTKAGHADMAIGADAASALMIYGLSPDGMIDDHFRQIKGEVDRAWIKANEADTADGEGSAVG